MLTVSSAAKSLVSGPDMLNNVDDDDDDDDVTSPLHYSISLSDESPIPVSIFSYLILA